MNAQNGSSAVAGASFKQNKNKKTNWTNKDNEAHQWASPNAATASRD